MEDALRKLRMEFSSGLRRRMAEHAERREGFGLESRGTVARFLTGAQRLSLGNAAICRAWRYDCVMQPSQFPPVTRCADCGAVGYNIALANTPCRRMVGNSRQCKGTNQGVTGEKDWERCPTCAGTGFEEYKRCSQCSGVKWLFVQGRGLR